MKTYVQQIMLGKITGTKEEAGKTLSEIGKAGYDGIEVNRFMIHPTPVTVRVLTSLFGMPSGKGGKLDWPALLKESGLKAASLHTDLDSLEKKTEEVLEDAKLLGTDKIVITGMYRYDYSKEEEAKKLSDRLNAMGKILKEKGFSLLYHNHNIELTRVSEEKTAYEYLLENTGPEYVNFEFDSYWFTDGGADAKEWMRKLGKRMKIWHITDRGIQKEGMSMTPIVKCASRELGYGNMDLEGRVETARENGVEDIVLESHNNWINNDPLQSILVSSKWLNERKETR